MLLNTNPIRIRIHDAGHVVPGRCPVLAPPQTGRAAARYPRQTSAKPGGQL